MTRYYIYPVESPAICDTLDEAKRRAAGVLEILHGRPIPDHLANAIADAQDANQLQKAINRVVEDYSIHVLEMPKPGQDTSTEFDYSYYLALDPRAPRVFVSVV
jgi:hypothetical protein